MTVHLARVGYILNERQLQTDHLSDLALNIHELEFQAHQLYPFLYILNERELQTDHLYLVGHIHKKQQNKHQ